MDSKNESLAKTGTTAIGRPDFSQDGDVNAGMENAPASRRPPRLVLCQSTTPQSKKSNPEYLDGLEEGNLFNDTEGTIYAQPLKFIVVNTLPARWIEFFDPKVDGKSGVKDFNIPVGDSRREFRDDGKGGRLKPIATEFRDFLVLLPDSLELLVLALKGTQISTADKLVKLIKMANARSQRQIFTLESVVDRKDAYTFYNVKIARAEEKFADDEMFAYARAAYERFQSVTIEVTHDEAAAESAEPGQPVDGVVVPEDVPF